MAEPRPKIGINDFINSCWDISDDGWTFDLMSDQWWVIDVWSEEYGKFGKASRNIHDVEETLYELLRDIMEKINGNLGI